MWHQYPWDFGEFLCDAKIVLTEAITYSSILTIMAISIERYMVICKQMKSKTETAKKIIVLIWIVSIVTALPWSFYTKVNYLTFEGKILEQSSWCTVPFDKGDNIGNNY